MFESAEGMLIAPVRPSAKSQHPFVPILEYIRWQDGEGRIYDPWLRSHVAAGGRVIGPCERSMVVEERTPFWEIWAGRKLGASGPLTLDGALVPIAIDLHEGVGRYEEPNIWVAYAQ